MAQFVYVAIVYESDAPYSGRWRVYLTKAINEVVALSKINGYIKSVGPGRDLATAEDVKRATFTRPTGVYEVDEVMEYVE